MFEGFRRHRALQKQLREDPDYYDTGLFSRKVVWSGLTVEDYRRMAEATRTDKPRRLDGTYAEAGDTEKVYHFTRTDGTQGSFMVETVNGKSRLLTEGEFQARKRQAKKRRTRCSRNCASTAGSASG